MAVVHPRARARHRGRGIPGKRRGHQSTIVVEGLAPTHDPVWDKVTVAEKRRFFTFAQYWALALFKRQLLQGIGADGKRLEPVAPETRAKGRWRSKSGLGKPNNPPLVPGMVHSRTIKWLRCTVSHARQSVSLWWSHNWMEILGYHAAGEVIGAPVRDVLGLSPASEKRLRGECERYWMRVRPHAAELARRRRLQDVPGSPGTRPGVVPMNPPVRPAATAGRGAGGPGKKEA